MRPHPLFQNHRGFSSFFRRIDVHELYITLGSGLDAETAHIQSYDNYYSALYDAIQADFELRRAVGDI